jgi:hypothetical protein
MKYMHVAGRKHGQQGTEEKTVRSFSLQTRVKESTLITGRTWKDNIVVDIK